MARLVGSRESVCFLSESWIVAFRAAFVVSGAFFLAGCSIQQLHDNTLSLGNTVGSLYTTQVLENLSRIDQNRFDMPSFYAISSGTIQTNNTVTPSVSIPLGNSVTRTVVSGGITQVVAPYNAFGLSVAENWQQTWTITPETDANALRILHATYLYALGQPLELNKIYDLTKTLPNPPNVARTAPGAASPATTTVFGTKPLKDDIDQFMNDCDRNLGKEGQLGKGCFTTKTDPPCVQTPSSADKPDTLVCLGKYGASLLNGREVKVSETAYSAGVLYTLALITLQAEADATAASPAKSKPTN